MRKDKNKYKVGVFAFGEQPLDIHRRSVVNEHRTTNAHTQMTDAEDIGGLHSSVCTYCSCCWWRFSVVLGYYEHRAEGSLRYGHEEINGCISVK